MALSLNTFVERYAEINNMPKTKSKEEILRFIDTFKTCTVDDNGVDINGFVKSEIIEKPERVCKNPRTQENIVKPKSKKIKVSAKPSFAKMLEE